MDEMCAALLFPIRQFENGALNCFLIEFDYFKLLQQTSKHNDGFIHNATKRFSTTNKTTLRLDVRKRIILRVVTVYPSKNKNKH